MLLGYRRLGHRPAEFREFRKHTNQFAIVTLLPFPEIWAVAGLGAIPDGDRRADASVRCGAVFYRVARGGQRVGNRLLGVGGTAAGDIRRAYYSALSCQARCR